MAAQTIIAGILMDENTAISFVEVCQRCNISEDVLIDLMEQGIVNSPNHPLKNSHVDQATFKRIQSACRLLQDLGINSSGVVLILELLDELEQAHAELSILQRHVVKA